MAAARLPGRVAWGLLILAAACVALAALNGCGRTYSPPVVPVAEILADPRGFDGRLVVVEGMVGESANFFLFAFFTVRDRSGEIVVFTGRAVPPPGGIIRVQGRVRQLLAFRDSSWTVLEE
jgi:hypothetical protein